MKSQKRKPRHTTLGASFGKGPYPDSVKVISETGEIQFYKDGKKIIPLASEMDYSYHRKTKEKVVRKYPIDPNQIMLHADYSIYNLDTVYIADTNTERDLSVTCVIKGKPVIGSNGDNAGVRFRSKPYIVFKGMQSKPEQHAWKLLLEREFSIEDGITGLIVDSDLDLIPEYNSRTMPITEDYFVPEQVQLIYASADVGKEHILNKIMSQADKAAKTMLNKIKSGEVVVE